MALRRCGNGPPEPTLSRDCQENSAMNNIIYIIGLVVVVVAVLGFLGLR